MAPRPANKGAASMRRAGGLADSDVVGSFDDPENRKALSSADKARDRAYKQGRAAAKRRVQETGRRRGHEPAQVHKDPELQSLYSGGFGDQLGDERRTRRQELTAPVGAKISSGAHDGAGVVLGMVAYALFLAYVKGGWSGVTGWLGAKFINKPHAQPTQSKPQAPFDPFAPGHGPGGSTLTPAPNVLGLQNGITTQPHPGPGDNQPQPNGPGGTVIWQ